MRIAKGEISDVLNIYQAIVDDFTEVINHKPTEEKQKYLYAARRSYKAAVTNLSDVIKQKTETGSVLLPQGKSKIHFRRV